MITNFHKRCWLLDNYFSESRLPSCFCEKFLQNLSKFPKVGDTNKSGFDEIFTKKMALLSLNKDVLKNLLENINERLVR